MHGSGIPLRSRTNLPRGNGMIYNEGRARRGGEVLPIECIRIRLTRPGKSGANMLHYHDYTELLFGLSGTAQVYIGSRSTLLEQGGLIVIQAGDAHNVIFAGAPCEYIVVKFLPQTLISAEQTGAEFGYALTLMERSPDRQSFFSPDDLEKTDIPALLQHMMKEWEAEQFGYELSLRADLTRVILFLIRRWKETSPWMQEGTRAADRETLRIALLYIGEHYAEVSERDVAEICGISTVGVSRLFSRVMKCTFLGYLCDVRLREAEKLLLTTDRSITEIAMQTGFSTSAYFISKFRQAKGVTPYRYRRAERPDAKKD